MESNGKRLLLRIEYDWRFISFFCDSIYSLAVCVLSAAALQFMGGDYGWLPFALAFLVFCLLAWRSRLWHVDPAEVVRYLNLSQPQLEESVQLILKPAASLSLLEQLQVKRLEEKISHLPPPALAERKLPLAIGTLIFSALVAVAILNNGSQLFHYHPVTTSAAAYKGSGNRKNNYPPSITRLSLLVTPPKYTVQSPAEQSAFDIHAIEGSDAAWVISTNTTVNNLTLVFNDKDSIRMKAENKDKTSWSFRKTLMSGGFYQVKIDGKISEMYMIDLQKDQPPAVHILTPKQYTTLELGARKQVPLRSTLSDDFGVTNAFITATIASGSGEAVKFKEQRIPFPDFSAGRESRVQKTLNLDQLGMKPGDELYYYVSAFDNHRQESRSDIYIITLPDTTELMEIEGLTNGVNLKLDYFRSQRQIIIETEQLLKDRDTIAMTNFNMKSNNLGIDQKLLRLRYGKFLGEETDNEIGAHHDDDGNRDETVFGDPTKIIEEFTHKHDNAEDATFFDPKLKEQLKATLSEMWKAELQLRLYKPQDALVYEYKALRLLKDLQQQSRSYVAKAAYKTTPLKPEKRLTGDLSKITQPDNQQNLRIDRSAEETLRQAAGLMEDMKVLHTLSIPDRKILQAAASQLGTQASSKPSLYLSSFEAMKRVLSATGKSGYVVADLNLAVKGIQNMIGELSKSPAASRAGIRQQLSQQYYSNLHSNR